MPAQKSRKIFVNIPVKDLLRSMTFFLGLGFSFITQLTDTTAAWIVLSEEG
jgi:predicted lactoylglutathione lyase